jgi:hypothetical protein
MRATPVLLILALSALLPDRAAAQCVPVALTDSTAPDVRIVARVRAASLRFESAPRADVLPLGCVTGDTVRILTRTNLPDPVEPGRTYRDVEIAVEIVTRLSVVCSGTLQELLRSSAAAPRIAALCAQPATGDNRRNP